MNRDGPSYLMGMVIKLTDSPELEPGLLAGAGEV